MIEVIIDGVRYRPVSAKEATALEERLREFRLEGTDYWRKLFIDRDTFHGRDGTSGYYGMYSEGDEEAPFFTEAFLYNLLGKDEARSVLGIVGRLCELAGVKFR